MTKKLDLKEKYQHIYTAKQKAKKIEIPELQYLMIDGLGDPNTAKMYQDALEVLYSVAYKIKFNSKLDDKKDFVVMPLEGLWWIKEGEEFSLEDKSNWQWTMMIMQPEFISQEKFDEAIKMVKDKKDLLLIEKIRLQKLPAVNSYSIMHVGPYENEKESLEKLHKLIKEDEQEFDQGIQKHHEIYLSDVRRTKPENLRTILRQDVQ